MSDDEPKKRKSVVKTLVLPLGVATALAAAILIVTPEVGPYAAVSAWIGTVLVLGVWGQVS